MIFEQNKESAVERVTSTNGEQEPLEMAGKKAEDTIEFYKKLLLRLPS
ncbi:MAG: hypothetical protein ACLPX5_05610 [Dissulfurispiraceae bacterium]